MLSRRLPPRRGVTLIELIVAMVVAGVGLALIATISVRQQRLYADIADRTALAGQLRQASTILPIELRGASPGGGDIREASDTAIELRASIASAVVCDTAAGSIVLAPAVAGPTTFASYLTAIAAGDTAWILTRSDSADAWLPYSVSSTATFAPGSCAPFGPQLTATARATARVSIRLAGAPPVAGLTGTVVRVTRPVRYSLYRGGDGRWYLGQRDWNVASVRFNTVQPVSGPFSPASAHGLVFQFSDSAGGPLVSPVADPRAIALVRVDLRGQSRGAMRAFAPGAQGTSSDSLHLAISLRNRR
jgi:prepilin-type N-terminal cleavage/methylation domain-containing protein